MSTQTFEASSVDAALEEAATALGIAAGDLQYEVEEKASDFWGLGDTVYVVTVTLPEAEPEPEPEPAAEPEPEAGAGSEQQEPEEAPAEAADTPVAAAPEEPEAATASFFTFSAGEDVAEATPEPVSEAPDGPSADEEAAAPVAAAPESPVAAVAPTETAAVAAEGADLTKEAAGILDGIFSAMGFECTAEAKLDGDTMQVAITGEDNQYLLEGRGRGLAALELILNHSFRAWPSRAHKRVRVDAGDFRSQRDDEIRDMAYQVAHRAKETSSEQQTSELNPYERRIVHLTLAEDHQVTTRSLGNGFLKAVNVIPTSGRQRRDQ